MDLDFKKILIAVDDSPFSERAVQTGYRLAHATEGEVTLIHVIDITLAAGDMMSGAFAPELLQSVKDSGAKLLADITARYAQDVPTRVLMPEDRPVQGILKIAAEWQPHLIVLGTHGRTGLEHLLMGSVAEQVVRKATCPVLVVPKP
ncbi:MAG: universal stress protein [Solitalea sp.]